LQVANFRTTRHVYLASKMSMIYWNFAMMLGARTLESLDSLTLVLVWR